MQALGRTLRRQRWASSKEAVRVCFLSSSTKAASVDDGNQGLVITPRSSSPRGGPFGAAVLAQSVGVMSELSKAKLSGFVSITALAGYAATGAPLFYGGAAAAPGLFESGAALATAGTFLCSASANACNQIYERDRDALMNRTKRRPLPSGRCGVGFATAFAGVSGAAGVAALAATGSSTAAALGLGNLLLYAGVYTPLKQRSELNTWVGAVVGAVPPLIGWAAAGEPLLLCVDFLSSSSSLTTVAAAAAAAEATPPLDAYALATALYLWQFPHFFALAWRHRLDYARGGYAMVAVNDPTGQRTARFVWNYAAYATAIPFLAVAAGATSYMFALEGTALNALLLHAAHKFGRDRSNANATRLFRVTLVYLPVLLLCFVLHSNRLKQDNEKKLLTNNDNKGGLTLGDALEPLRRAGQRLCVHEVVAHARRPTRPSFCPLDAGGASPASAPSADADGSSRSGDTSSSLAKDEEVLLAEAAASTNVTPTTSKNESE
mmetsp:Transcript_20858/g.67187  ORF Transcript_20858/g.67187 Transcript_20858/m.67187 type:complete len:493 (-) Transcript_20858:182-1660(-)